MISTELWKGLYNVVELVRTLRIFGESQFNNDTSVILEQMMLIRFSDRFVFDTILTLSLVYYRVSLCTLPVAAVREPVFIKM